MSNRPTFLDPGFDFLSSIPYLKRILFAIWIVPTVRFGWAILLHATVFFLGKVEFGPESVSNLIMWITINPIFAGIFYLWNRRDKERDLQDQNSP